MAELGKGGKARRHGARVRLWAAVQKAQPIIHLGATSCYVTDNSELMMIYDALRLIKAGVLNVMQKLRDFALRYMIRPR